MPALINHRLEDAFALIPVEDRSPERLALAALSVMQGAAVALGQGINEISYFEPTAGANWFLVSWPEGPSDWAVSAAAHNQHDEVALWPLRRGTAIAFRPFSA